MNNRIESCRSCGSPDLAELFSLGEQYVSTFLTEEQATLERRRRKMVDEVIRPKAEQFLTVATGRSAAANLIDVNYEGEPVRCPIEIVLCRACTLVQQRWTAPQEFMYTRHYWYRSGTTATMRDALRDVAAAAAARLAVGGPPLAGGVRPAADAALVEAGAGSDVGQE